MTVCVCHLARAVLGCGRLHLRRVGSLSDSDDIMDKKEFIKFFTDASLAL